MVPGWVIAGLLAGRRIDARGLNKVLKLIGPLVGYPKGDRVGQKPLKQLKRVWLATDGADGPVTGGIVLAFGAGEARIANLAVDPARGGQGIGRALMAKAEAQARTAGHNRIVLATHRDMTPTLRFYRNDGWEETGREGYRVFMEKRL